MYVAAAAPPPPAVVGESLRGGGGGGQVRGNGAGIIRILYTHFSIIVLFPVVWITLL